MMNGPPSAVVDGWGSLSDEQVVARVVAGDAAIFEVLMRRHNERIYRAARAIVKDASEAEDVMQQAYVNAYAHLRQFDGRAQFSTWLTRIAVHEALARTKRRGRYTAMDGEAPASGDRPVAGVPILNPERLALSHELGTLMESAIDQLPDGAREVFMLRQVEGMSTGDVATALDVTEDVVKTRLSRARAALRRALSEHADAAASNIFRFERPRCDRVVASVLGRLA